MSKIKQDLTVDEYQAWPPGRWMTIHTLGQSHSASISIFTIPVYSLRKIDTDLPREEVPEMAYETEKSSLQ